MRERESSCIIYKTGSHVTGLIKENERERERERKREKERKRVNERKRE